MSNVYFIPLADAGNAEISSAAAKLLEHILEAENIALSECIPLKVHCGEAGNRTFIRPECYNGVIDVLEKRSIRSCFIETSVLYGGKRGNKAAHTRLAADHGFTRIPFAVADGENGEMSYLVAIDGKHFKQCHLGKGFEEYNQLLVMSHFKGHALAGFGGSIKQLSMGFASKGGKMAMHLGVKPRIRKWFCKKCGLCLKRCQVGAITLEPKPVIDSSKCLGCGACYSACRNHAVSILSLKGLLNAAFKGKFFREKLVEYALAAHSGRKNIYFVFALNITRGCDCEPVPMFKATKDIGIFVSTDPVAADTAAFDACARQGKRFRGYEQLAYAEKIGLGSKNYQLITLE